MSRLRKEVLASRMDGNGEVEKAGVRAKQAPRGLAVKAPGRLAVGGGRLQPGTRSETRSLEAETHDLERQLDSLRLQMALEKERQQSLV
jgi:hypothetical protein